MPTVIVIGAGISGLAAAWHLHSAGIEPVVYEQSDRVGGRINSLTVNGCTMEAGANFITDAYTLIPQLARDMGIPLHAVSNNSAIAIDEQLYAFQANRPATAMKSGLLPAHVAIPQLPGLARFASRYRGRGTVDPLDWIDLDSAPATTWAQEIGLAALAERSWRPAYHGFYFQDTHATSAAAVAAMAGHGLRQQTLTMPGGLSSLTNALAAKLDVRTGTPVTGIDEEPTSVTVHTKTGSVHADFVIVALPGPAIQGLMALNPVEAAVTQTSYSAGLLVGLGTTRHLYHHELGGAYGVLLHPEESPLAAICVASRAGHAHGPGDVVTCMLTDHYARALAMQADTRVITVAQQALLAWAPDLRDALLADPHSHCVVRIPHAMPTSVPGRLSHIRAYREHAENRRVIFAGDSLAWPWSDSAAFTGRWAANLVLR